MANDLSTLNGKLATALRDTANAVWVSAERDDLIKWAVSDLYPAFPRPVDPTTTTIALAASTWFYALPTGIRDIHKIELYSGTLEFGEIDGRSWEIVGDTYAGTAKLHIAPVIVEGYPTYTVRVHGFGIYDTSTNLIADDLVPLVLAMARAEAYRRMGADRAQFRQFQNSDPTRNISTAELLQLISEAEREVAILKSRLGRAQRRPVPARQ